jgi:uncharacterized protein (DUF4415 family)
MSGSRRAIVSDLKKLDQHELTEEDYDEIPELDDDFFERADLYHGDQLIRRGRPRSEHPKVAISIRLSEDVVSRFKSSGPGWQTRIDDALKQWLAEHPDRLGHQP